MISRRRFFSIAIIIFVVLFMFQMSNVVKETWNNYNTNQYADSTKTNLTAKSAFSLDNVKADTSRDYVIYIGNTQDSSVGKTVKQWCTYTKRKLVESQSLKSIQLDLSNPPEVVLLDANYMDWNTDVNLLDNMIYDKINIIFCNMPSVDLIKSNTKLREMLGITFVSAEKVELQGIKLFDGFLLGGEELYSAKNAEDEKYQDMDLNLPWYSVTSGTKTYMVGILKTADQSDVQNEYLPAIIWRNSIGEARVFAVNGDYISDNVGVGILDAMMAELNPYELYPVVNAQTIVALNYPVLAEENEAEINNKYYRSSSSLLSDIVWPGLVSLSLKMNAKITCIMNPRLNYDNNNFITKDKMQLYFKLISEQQGEVGIMGTQKSNLSLKDKLNLDNEYISSNLPDYKFTTFYAEQTKLNQVKNCLTMPIMQQVRTILLDYQKNDMLGAYLTDDVLTMDTTIDGFSHTFSEDLRVKSIETALGYSSIAADMQKVVYPENNMDEWQNMYNDLSRFTTTYWGDFKKFDQTTLSESDERMRKFLAMDYSDTRTADSITLKIQNFDEDGYFILRTHDEDIQSVKGGTFEKIENNAYLIHASQDTVVIRMKKNEKPFYSN